MSEERMYYDCGSTWEKDVLKHIIDTKLTNEQAYKLLMFLRSLNFYNE